MFDSHSISRPAMAVLSVRRFSVTLMPTTAAPSPNPLAANPLAANEPSVKPAAVVILAAGQGTRMKSAKPKVLHEVCGRSLLGFAVEAAKQLDPAQINVVVRHDRDAVAAHAQALYPQVVIADQDEIPGTGRAAQLAMEALDAHGEISGPVVITYSDVPLLDGDTLAELVANQVETGAAMALLSTVLDDPTGYGRMVRDQKGDLIGIVEEKDASAAIRQINEVNAGVYAVDAAVLRAALQSLKPSAVTGEVYLTDIVDYAVKQGLPVKAVIAADRYSVEGCNDKATLAMLGKELNRRIVENWMLQGVTVIDPDTTWIDVDVTLEPDVTIEPGVQLRGKTTVARGATVGPDSTLTDMTIGAGASVVRSHGSETIIGPGAQVGPFAFMRPGTVLGADGKIGAYCETKNAQIGDGSKVPHLSYVGDVEIGTGSNIGAATIFANYDGVHKHHTKVGNEVRIGSDSIIVAPVTIGDGAYTAAGSVITEDVPAGALGIGRAHQHNSEGWTAKRRAGTPAADAAAASVKSSI